MAGSGGRPSLACTELGWPTGAGTEPVYVGSVPIVAKPHVPTAPFLRTCPARPHRRVHHRGLLSVKVDVRFQASLGPRVGRTFREVEGILRSVALGRIDEAR